MGQINATLLLLLVMVWALVLLPGALRARRRDSQSSVGRFGRVLHLIRGSSRVDDQPPPMDVPDRIVPGFAPAPSSRSASYNIAYRSRRRALFMRRRVLLALVLSTFTTSLVALVVANAITLTLLGISATLLVADLVLLRRRVVTVAARRAVVRQIQPNIIDLTDVEMVTVAPEAPLGGWASR